MAGIRISPRDSGMRIREMLRMYIASHNFSQQEVAAEIGIESSTLSKFLNNNTILSGRAMARIIVYVFDEPAAGAGAGAVSTTGDENAQTGDAQG